MLRNLAIAKPQRLARSLSTTVRHSAAAAPATSSSASLADHEAAQPNLWKGTNTNGGVTTNLIGGEWTTGEGVESWIDVNDPSTQRLLTRVPQTSFKEMTRIVDRAEDAFYQWRETSVLRRQGVMLSYVSAGRSAEEGGPADIYPRSRKGFKL